MTLAHPHILWLLLLVPFWVALRYARWRQPTLAFSDGQLLEKLPMSWAVRAQAVLPLLYGGGLACLLVALARPQKGLQESRVQTEAVDIVLVADVSTSMRAEDFSTPTRRMNRLDAAKLVMEKFIQDRPRDRIGLVAFAVMPYTMAPLTLDHGWLIQRVRSLETGMVEDGTAIGDALASAANRLRDSKAKSKVIILLTDGIQNAGRLTPDNAAQAAKALGIKIYAVGAGRTGLVPYPVADPYGGTRYVQQVSEIDEPMLKRISAATGGAYFRATDLEGLRKVYEEIDAMEKTEMEIEKFTSFEERFAPWVAAGLVCLIAEKLLSLTRLGRAP